MVTIVHLLIKILVPLDVEIIKTTIFNRKKINTLKTGIIKSETADRGFRNQSILFQKVAHGMAPLICQTKVVMMVLIEVKTLVILFGIKV